MCQVNKMKVLYLVRKKNIVLSDAVSQLENQDAIQEVADFDVATRDDQDLLQKVRDVDIIIGGVKSEQVFKAAKKLKMIQVTSAGYDSVNMDAAAKYGVIVCNNSGVNAQSVAEQVFGLIIDVARRISAHDRSMRAGRWERLEYIGDQQITGKTLGIIGLGNIGSRMAQIGSLGFKMPVIAYDPYISNERAAQFNTELVDMKSVFKNADIVTIHVPLNDETRHFVKKEHFDLMKPASIFINASRGPTVDEKALISTLEANKICGAGIDVFETEPLQKDSPLRSMENVVVVPHMGSSLETQVNMRKAAVKNVVRVINGMEPHRIVNPEVYYTSKKWFPQ